MKKALILIIIVLAVFIGEIVIFDENGHAQEAKPYIAVTNFALYDIATHVVGEKVEVKKLIPFGVDAHTYMPSVKTMSELSNAELFLFIGLGMEPWIKKEKNGLDMSRFVQLKAQSCSHKDEHEHGKGSLDPHYWLSIENMILMTRVLVTKAAEHFPEQSAEFHKNAQAYIEKLRELDTEFKERLAHCKRTEIVLNHNAFSYLAQSYGFTSHSVTGLSPDEQASAKQMREIIDLVKNEGIEIIFFESFVSPKVSETIAKETGARVDSLQPLANVTEDEAGRGYIGLMRENLDKLSSAMECE